MTDATPATDAEIEDARNAMSEPITRADLRSFLVFAKDHPGWAKHFAFDIWCQQQPEESASPPRAPWPPAPYGHIPTGVESGPGQPTGLARIEINGFWCFIAAPVAAEITRLREEVSRLVAVNDLGIPAAREKGRRAGIEAAAQAVAGEKEADLNSTWNAVLDVGVAAIRALAEKPAA